MPRYKEAPDNFVCPYRDRCPELEGLSTNWVFAEYQRSIIREQDHWRIRDEMAAEIKRLEDEVSRQNTEIDQLKAENKRLHQSKFKARSKKKQAPEDSTTPEGEEQSSKPTKKRGAPKGHPAWSRKVPDRVDQSVHVAAPERCPHCDSPTDLSRTDSTSYLQEDIVLRPQTVVTSYTHETAHCPKCRRQVFERLEGELPFAPIGPQTKAAALYLRHAIKLPYRKIQEVMSNLFGLDFVPASALGFEKRAYPKGDVLYEELIQMMRHSDIVHADETYWREDGENVFVWYGGNEDVAVFRIDPHRSAEAAKSLLGEQIDGLLVTDAYASYNAIEVKARQSCLSHILGKAKEITQLLAAMKNPDENSVRFCVRLKRLLKLVCAIKIPTSAKARKNLTERLLGLMDKVCGDSPLAHGKTETLRKRLIPGAREYAEVFAFIKFGGPPTNNHAERALRPLVIFRKVCMGSRSPQGSRNIAVFNSLAETAKLQECPAIDLFETLLTRPAADAYDLLFNNSS